MKGIIFDIEEFSVYDGPGIRTTVFLKGCPLHCKWCHNPEGQSALPEIIRSPNGCIKCGNCLKTAVVKNGRTVFDEKSIMTCPKNLLRICGEEIEAKALCERLLKNKDILAKGGVTFSGGEPLMQSIFLGECLLELKGILHTAVQTSGYSSEETFVRLLHCADYFLYDIKLLDEVKSLKYTGVSSKPIIDNFKILARSGVEFVTRIPLIPSVTDTEKNIKNIAALLKMNNVKYCELLPYNKMAGGKYKMLMREYKPGFDEKTEVNIHKEIFNAYGINARIM